VLWPSGAISVSVDSDGRSWLLYDNGSSGHNYIGRLEERRVAMPTEVPAPADYVAAGDNVIWVVFRGAGGTGASRLTAVDARTGQVAMESLEQVALRSAVVSHDGLYVETVDPTGEHVALFGLNGGRIVAQGSVDVAGAGQMAVTQEGHVWVASWVTAAQLTELVPNGGSLERGVTVDGPDSIYGPTGAASTGDSLWASDRKRIISLTPKDLATCVSCAEGLRLDATDYPSAVVTAGDGSVFVATLFDGIAYYSAENVQHGGSAPDETLDESYAPDLSPDPSGGVDYVDRHDRLIRWDPARAESR
jgi:hypothetical protein